MVFFDFLKKKEVVNINTPIEVKKNQPINNIEKVERSSFELITSSVIVVEGFKKDVEPSEVVDFIEH
jgi:hypothetical protein